MKTEYIIEIILNSKYSSVETLPVVAFRGSLFQILKEDEDGYYYRERTLTMQECLTIHLSSLC